MIQVHPVQNLCTTVSKCINCWMKVIVDTDDNGNRPCRGYCTTTSASTAYNYFLEYDYSQYGNVRNSHIDKQFG